MTRYNLERRMRAHMHTGLSNPKDAIALGLQSAALVAAVVIAALLPALLMTP